MKNKINEEYFKVIDDGHKAYWLGFIAADGCINKDNTKLSLCLKDLSVIEKFKKDTASTYKISSFGKYDKRTNKTYYGYSIQVTNKIFISHLIDKGITNKKTDCLSFPDIHEEYYPYFIAGLFDGDGSVFVNKSQNGLKCNLISTEEILSRIDEILFEKFGIKHNKHIQVTKNKPNVYKEYWYKESEDFLNYIYCGDKDIYLERKYSFLKDHKYKDKTRNRQQCILKYDVEGNFVEKYPAIKIAAQENEIYEQGIIKAYKQKRLYKDFYWVEYDGKSNYPLKIAIEEKKYDYEIQQIDSGGNIVNVFHSLREAESHTGIKHSNICNCINGKTKTTKGYTWKKKTLK